MIFKTKKLVSDTEVRKEFIAAIAESVTLAIRELDISEQVVKPYDLEQLELRKAMFEAANAAVFNVMNLLDGTGSFGNQHGMPKLIFEDFNTKRQILLTDEAQDFLHDEVMGETIRWFEENLGGTNT